MSDTSKSTRIGDLDAYLEECFREKPAEEVENFYGSWAETYDEEVSLFNYNGPKLITEAFAKLNVPEDAEIIDIAAGTGNVGIKLKEMGYKNIDALDGTKKMLEIARKKNVYRNFYHMFLGCGNKSPIKDGTYDVAISCGGIGPGHIPYSAFHEVLAMVKQGGLICWLTVNPNEGKEEESFKNLMAELTNNGKWKAVQDPIRFEEFFKKEFALFHVMKKL
ncbi:methyltransferase-like protein 27 [Limulus polyphemus]|uniref:Methyltransferase-like protein 27 n=1 Tax=Limulus polyphemus TaxID=6850 RepID=A0ABM1C636_LIMPO|nr:methyltransferase-like protein 27 [Limulus polyphemus]XP_013794879.1 methyltransferase-like protein 27 [Limulus polyphemus]